MSLADKITLISVLFIVVCIILLKILEREPKKIIKCRRCFGCHLQGFCDKSKNKK